MAAVSVAMVSAKLKVIDMLGRVHECFMRARSDEPTANDMSRLPCLLLGAYMFVLCVKGVRPSLIGFENKM